MKNFIKLTTMNSDKVLILNSTLIESILEQKNGSYIVMGFDGSDSHYVKETPEEIVKLIEKSNYFTTITKNDSTN